MATTQRDDRYGSIVLSDAGRGKDTGQHHPVGAGYAVTSCDMHVFVYEAAQSVAS